MSEKIYKIGEAAQLLNLKSYVLRFWETEFPQLKPTRTESGQRLYSERDLELLGRIRHLLHERGLTIEGARKILSDVHYATDDGLSRELLDEGYKDFIADLEVAEPHGFDGDPLPAAEALAEIAKMNAQSRNAQAGNYGPLFSVAQASELPAARQSALSADQPAAPAGLRQGEPSGTPPVFIADTISVSLPGEVAAAAATPQPCAAMPEEQAQLDEILHELKEIRALLTQPSQA